MIVGGEAAALPPGSDTDALALALLRDAGLNVHDGYVRDSDENTKTISAPLPYVVYYTTPGRPIVPRTGGVARSRAVEFQVTAVGSTREQAQWARQKAEAALHGVSVEVNGRLRRISRTEDNVFIGRDDTWNRPDGGPLFMAPIRFVVAV